MKLDTETRALITGAGSGLGRALALDLARRGARVAVTDREADRVEAVVAEVEAAGGQALGVILDVTAPADWEAAAALLTEGWGGLDLLVNNAGIADAGGIVDVSLEAWRRQIEVNLMGTIHGCRTFCPSLVAQGVGHVLNIASFAGVAQAPGMVAYNTSKAGVIALSETLSVELGPLGVGVSLVCPAFFPTRLTESMTETPEAVRSKVEQWMASSGLTAEEVAARSLEAVEKDRFLVLTDGASRRWWWVKRMAPGVFRGLLRGQLEQRMKRLEKTQA